MWTLVDKGGKQKLYVMYHQNKTSKFDKGRSNNNIYMTWFTKCFECSITSSIKVDELSSSDPILENI